MTGPPLVKILKSSHSSSTQLSPKHYGEESHEPEKRSLIKASACRQTQLFIVMNSQINEEQKPGPIKQVDYKPFRVHPSTI
ncbi:hypothetical protein HMPREF0322_02930 [Desulfitobacterium hafniense DP7]|uniref:Uncharacterized protein n=1 Tax=Desulfitobacterium hafniense DP7 TaxID=537010 RepID=G9XPN4_DESHA|nr:hypothetical protein HMPREF0322_02930 [Desulfitobacterium hafniense DP7]